MAEFSFFEHALRKIHEYRKISQVDDIARRYLAMNTFDGVLGMLGILAASYFAEIAEAKGVIAACLGSSIAIGISGFYGTYMTESAERKGKLKRLEHALSIHLQHSHIGKAHRYAAAFLAMINGLSSTVTSLFILLPFFIGIALPSAYFISISMAFIILFILGYYLGRISEEDVISSGVKMLVVGIILTLILIVLEWS